MSSARAVVSGGVSAGGEWCTCHQPDSERCNEQSDKSSQTRTLVDESGNQADMKSFTLLVALYFFAMFPIFTIERVPESPLVWSHTPVGHISTCAPPLRLALFTRSFLCVCHPQAFCTNCLTLAHSPSVCDPIRSSRLISKRSTENT